MIDSKLWSLVAGVVGAALVLISTVPSLFGIASLLRAGKVKEEIYKDKDGIATEKSMAAYSAKIPKAFLTISNLSGLATSIALAILGTLNDDHGMFVQNWLNVAQWVSTRDGLFRPC